MSWFYKLQQSNSICCLFRSSAHSSVYLGRIRNNCHDKQGAHNQCNKTGKIYTLHIYIQEDQREFLRAMKAKYLEKFKVEPLYVLASTVNKIERSICRGLQDVFKNLFGDDHFGSILTPSGNSGKDYGVSSSVLLAMA